LPHFNVVLAEVFGDALAPIFGDEVRRRIAGRCFVAALRTLKGVTGVGVTIAE
jgi:hypothetical protein